MRAVVGSPGKSCDLCGAEQRNPECNSSCEMYLHVGHDAPFGVSVMAITQDE